MQKKHSGCSGCDLFFASEAQKSIKAAAQRHLFTHHCWQCQYDRSESAGVSSNFISPISFLDVAALQLPDMCTAFLMRGRSDGAGGCPGIWIDSLVILLSLCRGEIHLDPKRKKAFKLQRSNIFYAAAAKQALKLQSSDIFLANAAYNNIQAAAQRHLFTHHC